MVEYVTGGSGDTIDPIGVNDPEGPSSNDEPEMTFIGNEATSPGSKSWSGVADGDVLDVSVGGNQNPTNGEITFTGKLNSPTENWTYTGNSSYVVSLAVDTSTETVYSGNLDNYHAIDASTGSQDWTYTGHSQSVRAVAVDESTGMVYSGSDNAEVHAIDASVKAGGGTDSEAREWTYTGHSETIRHIAVDESTGTLYTASDDNEVHAIDASTGSQDWTYTEHTNWVRAVAVDESTGMVYSGSDNAEVHAIDASVKAGGGTDSDAQEWTFSVPGYRVQELTVDESTGTVYSASGGDAGRVHAIDASTGSEDWAYTQNDYYVYAVAVDEGTGQVYSGGSDTEVHALNASTGSHLWTYTGHSGADMNAAEVDESTETVYTGADDDEVHALPQRKPTNSPAIDIDSDGTDDASYSGELADGETHTESVDFATQSYSMDVSLTDGNVDVTASWTENSITEGPSVDITGDGAADASETGTLGQGETTTVELSELTNEQQTVDTRAETAGPAPDWEIAYTPIGFEIRAVGPKRNLIPNCDVIIPEIGKSENTGFPPGIVSFDAEVKVFEVEIDTNPTGAHRRFYKTTKVADMANTPIEIEAEVAKNMGNR